MKPFSNPGNTLRGLDADHVARVVSHTADLALIIDADGRVTDVALGADDLPDDLDQRWGGRAFVDTVTVESREKALELVGAGTADGPGRWRHLNHPLGGGPDLPIMYRAIALGSEGRTLVVGRDLRTIAQLQQRLIDAQQSLERDYGRLRQAETRYRLLFQVANEPILIVDATTQRVLESNPAAARHFGGGRRRTGSVAFPEGFDADGARAIDTMLAGVRATGRPEEVVAAASDGARYVVSATLFRQEASALFLVRIVPAGGPDGVTSAADAKVLRALADAPDAFALTDGDGRIVQVNAAFVDLAQLATLDQALGEALDRWIGRSGVDLNVVFANLRERGVVKLFATQARSEYGMTTDVEMSAVAVVNGGKPSFAFLIRSVGQRLQTPTPTGVALPRSVDQLAELVGQVSLKDLVRETTDMIERLYIEAALEMTGNNRASAAELLGLSRQSLYVKLHRYGLRDANGDDTAGDPSAGTGS